MKHEVTLTKENHLGSGKTVTTKLHFDTVVKITRVDISQDGISKNWEPFLLQEMSENFDLTQWLADIYPGWIAGPIELRD